MNILLQELGSLEYFIHHETDAAGYIWACQ